jgi:hypothetical protein
MNHLISSYIDRWRNDFSLRRGDVIWRELFRIETVGKFIKCTRQCLGAKKEKEEATDASSFDLPGK